VTVKLMPGNHDSILDEPHVREVARALNESLSREHERRVG
jgi:hypothetical protein